jgi:hypothetical protein
MAAESAGSVQRGPLLLLVAVLVVVAVAALVVPRRDRIVELLNPREPDVVLLVMDTVRADHLHACGYGRPNTPVLDGLKQTNWAVHCNVAAPAPWTIPSHLSFFTGRNWVDFRGANESPVTLAEEFRDRGYDTAFLSANMVLRKSDWFTKGFRQVEVARSFGELKGPKFPERLQGVLARTDRSRPLFLFLNLVDAHAPYPPIPAGVPWARPQRGIQHRRFSDASESPFKRFITGQMAPDEADKFEQKLVNGYDYGIAMADENVGAILGLLRSHGRLERVRVIITSDHGELLGEHDVVGHGDTLYEPGLRVPLFYYDSLARNPVALPAEMSGLQVWGLARDGVVGAFEGPRYATSYRSMVGVNAWNALALWPDDATKLVWRDGESYRYDLRADPNETNPLPIGDHPAKPTFEELVERNRRVIELEDADTDEETRQLLQQAGYLAPDEEG